jgi:hypothetical protein
MQPAKGAHREELVTFVKSKLPLILTCPSCGCNRPTDEMTIDKVFNPTQEKSDRESTRVNAFAEMFPGDERAARITDVADFESIFAKADALFRNKTWQIRCDDCDPEDGGYYWFPLGQCDTPAKALDCIMQLNERRSSPIVMNSFIDLVEYLFGRGAITDE